MRMQVKRVKDSRTKNILVHRIADIRGGVSVSSDGLGCDYLPEGAPLAYSGGKWHVLKVGYVTEQATGTTLKVAKPHNFTVGDVVLSEVDGKAADITKIAVGSAYDIITLSAALGTIEAGAAIVEAAAKQATSGAAVKYKATALNGTGQPFTANTNIITDAWVIGVIKSPKFPDAAKPEGIVKLPY